MKQMDKKTLPLPFFEDLAQESSFRQNQDPAMYEQVSETKEPPQKIERPVLTLAPVIPLRKKNDDYDMAIRDTLVKLNTMREDVFDLSLKLALSGRWKTWNNATPPGAEVTINEDVLRQAGDRVVERLILIHDLIKEFCCDVEKIE